MIGLQEAHTWFDTRFVSRMAIDFPGIQIFLENKQFSSPANEIFCTTRLVNSAEDTKPLDMTAGAYKYILQYEVIYFTPETSSTQPVQGMITEFSRWFNNQDQRLIPQAILHTDYTSVSNLGRRDSRHLRVARIPGEVHARDCQL